MPTLAHRIRLDPTPDQIQSFKPAAGTARFVWNWALDDAGRKDRDGAGTPRHRWESHACQTRNDTREHALGFGAGINR